MPAPAGKAALGFLGGLGNSTALGKHLMAGFKGAGLGAQKENAGAAFFGGPDNMLKYMNSGADIPFSKWKKMQEEQQSIMDDAAARFNTVAPERTSPSDYMDLAPAIGSGGIMDDDKERKRRMFGGRMGLLS